MFTNVKQWLRLLHIIMKLVKQHFVWLSPETNQRQQFPTYNTHSHAIPLNLGNWLQQYFGLETNVKKFNSIYFRNSYLAFISLIAYS